MTIPNLFYTSTKRDLLKLTGRDRQSFLQGMVSNDVGKLQPGDGCYAFMLDATGHVLGDMRVLNVGEYLLLDLEAGTAGFVAATLEKYLIMEKCRIADVTADYRTFAVGGSTSPDVVYGWAEVVNDADWREGSNAARALGGGVFGATARVDVVVAKAAGAPVPLFTLYAQSTDGAQVAELLRDVAGDELPEVTLDALRIEAGIPRFGVDMVKSVLAPETGQAERAISRKKGCYIGQEIVARIDARGHTNKGLTGFYLDPAQEELPAANAPVFVAGREAGRVTSAVVSPTLGVPVALGYLRNEFAVPGAMVNIGATDGATAVVAALPFITGEK